jgi:hypothetical protein
VTIADDDLPPKPAVRTSARSPIGLFAALAALRRVLPALDLATDLAFGPFTCLGEVAAREVEGAAATSTSACAAGTPVAIRHARASSRAGSALCHSPSLTA